MENKASRWLKTVIFVKPRQDFTKAALVYFIGQSGA